MSQGKSLKLYQKKQECVLVKEERIDECGNRTFRLILQKREREDEADSFETPNKSKFWENNNVKLKVKYDGVRTTVTAKKGQLFSIGDLQAAGLM